MVLALPPITAEKITTFLVVPSYNITSSNRNMQQGTTGSLQRIDSQDSLYSRSSNHSSSSATTATGDNHHSHHHHHRTTSSASTITTSNNNSSSSSNSSSTATASSPVITPALLLLSECRVQHGVPGQYQKQLKIVRCPVGDMNHWALEIGQLAEPHRIKEVLPAYSNVLATVSNDASLYNYNVI